MDSNAFEKYSILEHVETYTATATCINCPLDGQCEFVKCKEKEHERV